MNILRPLYLLLIVALAGCASHSPAPVEERGGPPPAAKPAVTAPSVTDARAGFYTVKKGDTLYSIALDHGHDYRGSDGTSTARGQALIKILSFAGRTSAARTEDDGGRRAGRSPRAGA